MSNMSAELESLYETYLSSALNKDYYGCLLARYQRYNTSVEIALAITASGSGISALSILQTDYGKYAWAVLTLVTGLIAVAKPFLQLPQKIEHYSKLFTGHLDNFLQMYRLVSAVRHQQEFSDASREAFERAFERYIQLSREDDPRVDAKLRLTCEASIKTQFPNDRFWWPTAKDLPPAALSVVESKAAVASSG